MPEMDGIEATRQHSRREIGRAGSPIPIAVMTDPRAMHKRPRSRCLEAGMSDYLVKPAKPQSIGCLLEKSLSRLPMRHIKGNPRQALREMVEVESFHPSPLRPVPATQPASVIFDWKGSPGQAECGSGFLRHIP